MKVNRKTILMVVLISIVLFLVNIINNKKNLIATQELDGIKKTNIKSPRNNSNRKSQDDLVNRLKVLDSTEIREVFSLDFIGRSPSDLADVVNQFDHSLEAIPFMEVMIAELLKNNNESACLAVAKLIREPRTQNIFISLLIAKIAKEDPQHSLMLAKEHAPEKILVTQLNNILPKLILQDPTLAFEEYAKISNTPGASMCFDKMMKAWADKPEVVLQYIKDNPDFEMKSEALAFAMKSMAKTNPVEALHFLVESNLGSDKLNYVNGILEELTHAQDIVDFANQAGNLSDTRLKNKIYSAIIPKLAKTDVDAAVRLLMAMSTGLARNESLGGIVKIITDVNSIDESIEKCNVFHDDVDKMNAEILVLKNIAQSNPLEALNHTLSQDSFQQAEKIKICFDAWCQKDAENALKWYIQHSGEENITAAINSGNLIKNISTKSPEQASQLLSEQPDLFPANLTNINAVSMQWVDSDPVSATRWLSTLAESADVSKSYMSAASKWAQYDAHNASKWVSGLKPGDSRDYAVMGIAENCMFDDEERSYEWIQTIRNEKLKQDALNRLNQISTGKKQRMNR